MQGERFFDMRQRAYELAEGGAYRDWTGVSQALRSEGFHGDDIARLGADRLAVMMIARCCAQARAQT